MPEALGAVWRWRRLFLWKLSYQWFVHLSGHLPVLKCFWCFGQLWHANLMTGCQQLSFVKTCQGKEETPWRNDLRPISISNNNCGKLNDKTSSFYWWVFFTPLVVHYRVSFIADFKAPFQLLLYKTTRLAGGAINQTIWHNSARSSFRCRGTTIRGTRFKAMVLQTTKASAATTSTTTVTTCCRCYYYLATFFYKEEWDKNILWVNRTPKIR